jgi:hypothetical protein
MRKFGSVGCGDKAPGNFDSRRLHVGFADPASAEITLNFFQLISINRKIAATLLIGSMTERP